MTMVNLRGISDKVWNDSTQFWQIEGLQARAVHLRFIPHLSPIMGGDESDKLQWWKQHETL